MKTTDSQIVTAPPSLTASLITGFDAVTNHIGLILFPVVVDLLLWFGPRLHLAGLINSLLAQAAAIPEMNNPEMAEMMRTNREIWTVLAERFNLFSALRSYPVGVPSLMVTRSPVLYPGGDPLLWEVPTIIAALGLWLLLILLGLVLGTLFYAVVAQASLLGKIHWRTTLQQWPWASFQVICLALIWLMIAMPLSCMASFVFIGGLGVGRFVLLLLGGLLIWLLLPLALSAHGIFVNHSKVWDSLKDGVRITRMTLPTTGLLFLVIVLISEGLDLLWVIPDENSWLTLVGVAGHAFVTTGLLAASFVYYRDADRWVQRMTQQIKFASNRNIHGRSV